MGFFAKRILRDKIDEKTLVLLSLYCFQPILIFWGLTKSQINYDFILTPIIYLVIVLLALIVLVFVNKQIFQDKKDQSIYLATSLVGNTGNLGIPLGIALFGIASVPYTSIINIANILFMYIFTVYFFARDKFLLKKAILSIFSIPGIWFAFLALLINYLEIPLSKYILNTLEMGAYTSMVIQLMIFGIYLAKIKIKTMPFKLAFHISFVKHIFLPFLGIFFILYFTSLDSFIACILVMELMVPLAVNNVNFAALFDCKPYDVTATVLISTLIFVGLLYFYVQIIEYFIR